MRIPQLNMSARFDKQTLWVVHSAGWCDRQVRRQAGTALVCAAVASTAAAQDLEPVKAQGASPDDGANPHTAWTVAPYAWAPNFAGKAGIGNANVSFSLTPSDIANDVKAGGMGYVTYTRGNRFYYFDALGFKFRDRAFDTFYNQDLAASVVFLELGYGGHFPFRIGSSPVVVSPYVGARYAALKVHVRYTQNPLQGDPVFNAQLLAAGLTTPPPSGASDSWIDPALGVFVDAPLGRRTNFLLKLDAAGFGLRNDRYLNALVGFRYHFSPHWSVGAGYRAAKADTYPEHGNDLLLKLKLQGPLAGVSYQW